MISKIFMVGMSSFILTYMLKESDGPFFIFKTFRHWCGIDDMEDGSRIILKPSSITALFSCFWCLTICVCAILSIMAVIVYSLAWYDGIYLWLSSTALSGIINAEVMR